MWEGLTKNEAKNKNSSPSAFLGTRGRQPLPRVPCSGTRERASSPSAREGTRGRIFLSFNGVGSVNRQVTCFFPSADLPRVLHSGKRAFAECCSLPSAMISAALGKASIPRVQFFPECNTRGRFSFPSA